MKEKLRELALLIVMTLSVGGAVFAADPRPPTTDDRCGVCGMYVVKYPNWIATVVFEDGSQIFFDGPKDLFRYILDLEDYQAENREISEIFVTDYYSTEMIEADEAFFVSGSDVMGPMGPELVPIAREAHAETFVVDHGGEAVLRFGEITREEIRR